jgi:hypothetical protein
VSRNATFGGEVEEKANCNPLHKGDVTDSLTNTTLSTPNNRMTSFVASILSDTRFEQQTSAFLRYRTA